MFNSVAIYRIYSLNRVPSHHRLFALMTAFNGLTYISILSAFAVHTVSNSLRCFVAQTIVHDNSIKKPKCESYCASLDRRKTIKVLKPNNICYLITASIFDADIFKSVFDIINSTCVAHPVIELTRVNVLFSNKYFRGYLNRFFLFDRKSSFRILYDNNN